MQRFAKKEPLFWLIAAVVLIVYVLTQSVAFPSNDRVPQGSSTPEIVVEGQGTGKFVVVNRIVLPERGFVAVHEQIAGRPGKPVAWSDIFEAGTHTNVIAVMNEGSTNVGQVLIAVIYTDTGDGLFNPAEDRVVSDLDGNAVAREFIIVDQDLLETFNDQTQ